MDDQQQPEPAPMKKVIGSHGVKDKTTAVLECGHEVPYAQVKWTIPAEGGVPEGMAKCTLRHEAPAP